MLVGELDGSMLFVAGTLRRVIRDFNLDRSLLLSCADDPKAESVPVFLYLAGHILTRCHSQMIFFFFFPLLTWRGLLMHL